MALSLGTFLDNFTFLSKVPYPDMESCGNSASLRTQDPQDAPFTPSF